MMNPSHIGGVRAFNDLYEDLQPSSSDPNLKRKVEEERQMAEQNAKAAKVETPRSTNAKDEAQSRKIYVGSLPANVTEKPLTHYFSRFGEVTDCKVIRGRTTGISRGFAFLSYICETMAEKAVNSKPHILDGRTIRVSKASNCNEDGQNRHQGRKGNIQDILDELILPNQNRIYVGPLDDSTSGADLTSQFGQFGTIKGVSRLKSADTHSKKSYGFIDFQDSISSRRAFASKVFVKGKHVKISMSRFAMDTVLSSTTVYFYEAHDHCDDVRLEKHFSKFGQIFRCTHFLDSNGLNKAFGFVDFVSNSSADLAIKERTQLLHPGQYVKVSKTLPQNNLFQLLAFSDKDGNELVNKMENRTPSQGIWGKKNLGLPCNATNSSKVRIPSRLVGKLVGERGKKIAEISRDSKTEISIPKLEDAGSPNVIITITGTKESIKTAQYLMQKVLKS